MGKKIIVYILFSLLSLGAYSATAQVKKDVQNTVKIGLKTDTVKLGYDRVEKLKKQPSKKAVEKDEETDEFYEFLLAILGVIGLCMAVACSLLITTIICLFITFLYNICVN